MNITKEDIRKALGSGSLKWSDIASMPSRDNKSYGEQDADKRSEIERQKTEIAVAPSKVTVSAPAKPTQSIVNTPDKFDPVANSTSSEIKGPLPQESQSAVSKSADLIQNQYPADRYNTRNLAGQSFKQFASSLYDNQLFKINDNIQNNIKPFVDLSNTLKDNANNPDLYELLNTYQNKRTQSVLFDPVKTDVNDPTSLRQLDNWEVPQHLTELNTKVGPQLEKWSNIDENSDKGLPKLSEVMAGKNINNTSAGNNWYKTSIDNLNKEYSDSTDNVAITQQSKNLTIANDEDKPDDISTVNENTPPITAANISVDKLSHDSLNSSGVKPVNDYLIKNKSSVAASIANASTPDAISGSGNQNQKPSPYDIVSNSNISMPFNSNKIYNSNIGDDTLFGSIRKSSDVVSNYINKGASDQLKVGYGVQKPEGVKFGSMWLAPEAKLGAEGKTGKLEKQDYPISDWVSQNVSEGLGQALRGIAIGTETIPDKFVATISDISRIRMTSAAANARVGLLTDPEGNAIPTFLGDKENKTLSDIYSEGAKQSKASTVEHLTNVSKAESQLPDTWQAKAGGIVPLAAVTIGGILSGQPEVVGAGVTASFVGTGYADALNLANNYEKETGKPISDDTKSALGIGTALIYSLPLGKLSSGLGGIIKKTPLKAVQESVFNFISKNPEVVSEAGKGVFKTFADQMPGAIKSFATTAGKGALHSVATMEGIGVAQNLLNEAIIGKHTDAEGWMDTFRSGLETGLMFSLATVPFAHASYAARSAMFKRATDSNGDVSLSVTNDGRAVYVHPKTGEDKTFGTTVDGKRVELNDDEIKRTFTMTSQHLKDELDSYKKTKTVNPDIEKNALENRVRTALSGLSVDGMIPIVRSPEKGMQIVTGESANGSALGVNLSGEKDYISKEAIPENAKFNDVYNELMAQYDKNKTTTEQNKPTSDTAVPPTQISPSETLTSSFSSTIESEPSAPIAVSGISNDSRYQPDALHNNAMIHLSDGMSSDMTNSVINAGVLRDMQMHDRIKKTSSYIDASNNGKENATLKYLEKLAKNPPVGIDPEDINNELKLAKNTLSVYKDKSVMGYANRAGGVGSENHKLLTSLIIDHDNSAKQFDDVKNELLTSYNKQKNDYAPISEMADRYADYVKPDVVPLVSPVALFDALSNFESLKDINIQNDSKNEHAVRKNKIINYELSKKKQEAAILAHNELANYGIIDRSEKDNVSFDELSKQIDSLNLPSMDKNAIQTLALSHISDISGKYESTMSKLLTNKKVGYTGSKTMDSKHHDIFVDKLLDSYRDSRKKEIDSENTKQIVDDIKLEGNVVPEPTGEYHSSSDIITPSIDNIKPQDTFTQEVPPVSPYEESQIPKPVTEVTPPVNTESPTGPEKVTPPIQADTIASEVKDEKGSVVSTDISSDDESVVDEVSDIDRLINQLNQDSIIVDQKPDLPDTINETYDNKEVLNAVESSVEFKSILDNEDTEAFNQLVEELPGLVSSNSIKHDRISHTLFANVEIPSIREFLMDPVAFKSAEVRIIVNKHNSGIGDTYSFKSGGLSITGNDFVGPNNYDPNDQLTWDNAYIKVEIKYKKGKEVRTIAFNMKNPGEREQVVEKNGMLKYSSDEIQSLRDFRNSIITEQLKVIADNSLQLRMLGGLDRGISKLALNRTSEGKAIQRGLHEVVGLLDEPDVNKLGLTNLTLAYGRGEKGSNLVVSLFETIGTSVNENAGSIFITKTEPFDANSERKIKVNKKKVNTDPEMADLVYKLAIDMFGSNARQITLSPSGKVIETNTTSPYGLTPASLLYRMVGFGDVTKMSSDSTKSFLEDKQFYVDNGILHYGTEKIAVNTIGAKQKLEILEFINNNLTWTINKDDLWNRENNTDNLVSDIFPGIKAFFDRNPNENSVDFTKQFSINRSDVGITWTAWLIKNKKLTSDIADGVFEPPYLFMTNVVAVSNGAEKITPVNNGAYNTSVTLVDKPIMDPTILGKEPSVVVDNTKSAKQLEIDAAKINYENRLKSSHGGQGPKLLYENALREIDLKYSNPEKPVLPNDIVLPKIITTPSAKSLDEFDDFGATRMIDDSKQVVDFIDTEKSIKFIKSKLGDDFDVKVLEDVISLHNGESAMGLSSDGKIDLYKLAEKGTDFHETYHVASLLLIPRSRRMAIYDSVRTSNESMKYATDKEIEEYLAEKFRERILSNNVDSENGTTVNIAFRKIYNAFNALRNFKDRDIERLYKDIERGVLKGVKPSYYNKEAFTSKYEDNAGAPRRFKEAGLQSIKTVEAKDKLVNSLTYYLFEISGIQTIDDINKLDYQGLKSSLLASAEKIKDNPDEIARYSLYKEAYDRFDDYFLPAIKAEVKNTGITEFTPKDDSVEDGIVGREVQEHDKASYEISKRDNIRAEVKFFIRTIPETIIKDNSAVVVRDPISKFPSFVEFELAWNTMIYELHKETTPDSMKKKIETLAHEKKNPFFIMLENRLSKMDDNFITKFWNTMYSHRHDYVNTVYNSNSAKPDSEYNRSIRNISSNIDRATRVLPILWGQNMMSGGYLYTVTDDGLVFNKSNAESIISRYKELSKSITKMSSTEDANKALDSFIDLLNAASIDVDMDTMEWIIGNNFPGFTRSRAVSILMNDYKDTAKIFTTILPQIIKDNGGKNRVKINELTPKVLLGGEKSINNYAKVYAQTHPNPQEVMVPGADGSNLYQISSRNFVTDVIDKISNNPEYLKNMLDVPINQGSILLNQIKNGTSKGISFGTFVKIYEEGVADQGRDYFDISPMEDYVIKMSNLLDSNITLPAMADKKTYGFIFGIKMPDMVSSDKGSQKMSWNGNTISYPSEVIDIFNGYYLSEFNSIKQAWAKYKEENGNKKNLINNYHYDNSGKWAAGHGNGLRFRYFDSLYINSKAVGDEYNGFVDLNGYIDKVIVTRGPIIGNDAAMDEAIQRLDKKFFSESYENKSKMISSTITAATKFEMDYAEEIGLISRTTSEYTATMAREGVNVGDIVKSTMYENKALDAALYNSNVADYIKAGVAPKDANMVAITNILANTAINSIISEFETDKLISKDLAYYKGSDDKTKRLSSVLSTGTALRNSFPEGHPLNGITSFNVAEISDSIIKSTEIDEIKNKSYAAQINKLLIQSGKSRIPNLSELYSNPGMKSELDAVRSSNKAIFDIGEKIIDNQSKAYEKVNVTDATVYISPYMYRSIMTRLGEDYFTPKVEEAFKLLESDDLSWMDDADTYEKVSQLALHPLKMVYFGDSFESGLNVPKLDKMAMFLLPKFMATGDLRNLYERMNNPKIGQQKIDMAPFSSAVKTYNDNPIAIYTGEDGSVMSTLDDIKVAQQSFEFLRHQLPTTPHEGATMAVATQVQKAAMGNIISDVVYPNITINGKNDVTGTQLKQEWVSALNELSDRGKADIEKEFGLKFGEDGNYEFNTKKMYDFLAIESENSGMPSDVTEMLASFDPANPKDMPLQALVDGAFVESKILSHILKSTVDVNTPGGMFIQMTPFGLKSFDNTNTQYKINGGNKLKFYNPDGSMDVVISITMFKDILPSDLNTHNAKIQWLLDNNIIGENSATCAIGYRIPTQGLSSIISAKFVDCLPEFMGDTIIMPDEFTALTGSDFDVDKLYISRYNFVKSGDKFIKAQMDDSKENKFQTNSAKAIQNRFIDVMLAVVSNPDSINETRIPLDAVTDPVKSALKEIDKCNKDDMINIPFAKSRLSYESRKKMEYASGKGGIPTFALAGVHHVLTQIAGLKFKDNNVVSKFGLEDIAKINGSDGLRILDWLSAMVNAHVDVAKDPYIIRMGVNQGTYKMTALLLRAGYGEKTFFFLSQPSLKDIYKVLARKGSEYLTGNRNSDKSSIDKEVNNMIAFYKKKAKETAKSSFDQKKLENLYEENDKGFIKIHNENAFNKNTLINNMARTNVTGFDHYYGQLVVLETYKELSKYASALSELVKYSQVDTKKAGNAFSAQRLFADKVNEIMMDPNSLFANVGDFFNNTFIYNKLNNSAGLSKNLSQGVFFRSTKSVEMSTDRILDAMGRRNLDNRDIITKISKYVDTKLKSDFFDKLSKEREVNVPKMFFGEHTMAKRLFSIQQRFPEDVKSNYFLRGMSAEIYSRLEAERPDQIRPRDNNTNEPGLTEKLKQHYSSALDSDNTEMSEFAKDFLLYQFYSTGDNYASNTVKISEYDRRDTGYYRFIADKLDELSSNDNEALTIPDIVDIFENRWYDEDLVPTVQHFGYTQEGKVFMPKIDSTKTINGVQYPLAFFNTNAFPLSGLGNIEENRPFVKIQMFPKEDQPFYVLYRLYGTSSVEGQSFPIPMYIAIDKKGSKKNALSMIEHNVNHSMVKNNILPESFSSKNRIGAQEYGEAASMAGQYNGLYANVKPSNILTFDLKNKEIISNIESVVEPTVTDVVNEPNKVEETTFTVEDMPSDGIDKKQIETINEGFKRSGLKEMTEEQFNSMDKDLLESLKACFGA